MISMLAGDVFDDARVRLRLRMFQVLYAIASVFTLRGWLAELRARRTQAQSRFSGGTTPVDPA